MTTPQAILTGFALVALAIASLPYSKGVIPKAQASDCYLGQLESDVARVKRDVSSIGSSISNLESNVMMINSNVIQELFALAAEGVKVTANKVVEEAAKLATELEDSGTVIHPEKH